MDLLVNNDDREVTCYISTDVNTPYNLTTF